LQASRPRPKSTFANLLSIVDECDLAFVHAFPFSPREGTPAARMPQLERRLIKERAARLREVGAAALNRHLAAWIGREETGVIERDGFARLPDFTPVHFNGSGEGFQRLRFTAHDGQHLIGAAA
jgi:threonylcarbamoyladenosine tRNA methylthiotransferase MtaB